MRKLLTKGSALFLATVLFCLGIGIYPMTPCDAKGNGAIDAKQGVVSIQFYLKNAELWATNGTDSEKMQNMGSELAISGGSGFFVGAKGSGAQYIVTNHHVVSDYIDAGEGGVYNYYIPTEYDGVYQVLVAESCELRVYYDDNDYDVAYVDCYGDMEKLDLAVLKLTNPTDKRKNLPIQIPTEEMVGQTVYTVGFPGNAENVYTSASSYGLNDITMHKGSISKFVRNAKGVERIQVDAVIQHGNSGGPLVTEEGNVIGVNTNVLQQNPNPVQIETDYYSINASDLVVFLDKNNIPYELATDGISPLILIIIACAVLGAAVVVVAVVLMSKKPKAGSVAAGTPAQFQAQPRPQAQGQRAFIRSMATQHNGMTLAVSVAPVMIGRDVACCNLVYAKETPGVSGKHCSVSYDMAAGEFVVTDLGSTYGTFLMNGQKLSANAPYRMRPGESFYVGDVVNVIRVELG